MPINRMANGRFIDFAVSRVNATLFVCFSYFVVPVILRLLELPKEVKWPSSEGQETRFEVIIGMILRVVRDESMVWGVAPKRLFC